MHNMFHYFLSMQTCMIWNHLELFDLFLILLMQRNQREKHNTIIEKIIKYPANTFLTS